ncbi:MAG: radical SAM protein [Candidatus Schekmanbacteria bacterium]|nr:radical SAM protein [Candidatus Schekmanbacteria bacterium]
MMIEPVELESPGTVKLSLASAMALDLKPGLFWRGAVNSCINILLNYKTGCIARCAYCGLSKARDGEYNEKSFIKVEWPILKLETVISAISGKKGLVRRICISMITESRAVSDTKAILRKLKEGVSDIPVSILLSPTIVNKTDMKEMKALGADKVGIAVDAADELIFDKFRGSKVNGPHKWERYWQAIDEAVDVFGKGNVGIHMMVGLGETEKQFVETMFKIRGMGAKTHLFSFFAEDNSPLDKVAQPPMGKYRRLQLARYLIDEENVEDDSITFRNDEVFGFGIHLKTLENIIETGIPFMTSGCTGKNGKVACNRPYGDSLPGDNIRSFPFKPEAEDIERIKKEIFQY